MPELWPTLCATVWPRAARVDTSSTLDRKRSGFEAKSPRVALKGIEIKLAAGSGTHSLTATL